MEKIKFKHLDLPIIRSCNLACKGCMTYSDHKNVKGLVRVGDSREWLKHWQERLDPEHITLFGGEPLLHPEFVDWALAIREIWGNEVGISMNTNGYYLDKLIPHVETLFNEGVGLSVIVSIQTDIEPHLSQIRDNIERFKDAVAKYRSGEWVLWMDEYDVNYKRWYGLEYLDADGISTRRSRGGFTVCEQFKLPWCTHYTGQGPTMAPVYSYDDNWHEQNFNICHVKTFTTLYNGRLYKCPPMGVLEHTLDTFDLKKQPNWAPYVDNYKSIGVESNDQEIIEWFARQQCPERVCNMCGFAGPDRAEISGEERSHVLKNYWKVN